MIKEIDYITAKDLGVYTDIELNVETCVNNIDNVIDKLNNVIDSLNDVIRYINEKNIQ